MLNTFAIQEYYVSLILVEQEVLDITANIIAVDGTDSDSDSDFDADADAIVRNN